MNAYRLKVGEVVLLPLHPDGSLHPFRITDLQTQWPIRNIVAHLRSPEGWDIDVRFGYDEEVELWS